MHRFAPIAIAALLAGCAAAPAPVGPPPAPPWRGVPLEESRLVAQEPRVAADLSDAARRAAEASLPDGVRVWVSVIDARDPRDPRIGSHLGDQQVPAGSLAAIPIALTALDQTRTGLLPLDGPLLARISAAVGGGDADAANALLDQVCNTAPGPELDGAAFTAFDYKRRTVVRHMRQIGLNYLWIVGKQHPGGAPPTGVEAQFLGAEVDGRRERDNRVSPDDMARLLYLLWRGAAVDREACGEVLAALRRNPPGGTILGSAVPSGTEAYIRDAVAGEWAHTAGILVGENGGALVVAIATTGAPDAAPAAEVARRLLTEVAFRGRPAGLPLP